MEGAVHVLCALFGMASWLAINGVWVELPLLVNQMPESWNLASQLTILTQCANVGPLIVTLMDIYCRNRLNLKGLIYGLLALGVVAQTLLYFFWDVTVTVGGSDPAGVWDQPGQNVTSEIPILSQAKSISLPFFILFFATSLVDCTSSVSFIPYMSNLQTIFLQSYFLGEGLSGFIPALVGIVQGVGATTCNATTNAPIYHDPRFDINVFWLVLAAIMFISSIAFLLLNTSCHKYFVDSTAASSLCESERSEVSESNRDEEKFNLEIASGARQVDSDDDELVSAVPVESSTPQWRLLYSGLFVVCLLSNGFLPAISTYTSMPYGSDAYHASTILLTLANPIACLIAYFRPIKQPKWIYFTIFLAMLLAGYNIFLAIGSPCPFLVDTLLGSSLMVISTTFYTFLTTLAKVSFADLLRNNATARHLLWFGSVTQVGSFCGALISYPLVNSANIFVPRYDCQLCP